MDGSWDLDEPKGSACAKAISDAGSHQDQEQAGMQGRIRTRSFWEGNKPALSKASFEPRLGRTMLFFSGKGFGCWVCKQCNCGTAWGRGTVQVSRSQLQWKRHQASAKHNNAVARWSGAKNLLQKRALPKKSVPPKIDMLRKVLQETIATGATAVNGMDDVGARKKVRKLQYCLAQAKRDEFRKFWAKCASMTLAQDKRGSRLLARWRACTPNLELRTGIIGLAQDLPNPFDGKLGADSTRHATVAMLARATSQYPAPYTAANAGEIGTPNTDEFAHLCSIIEVFVADAAADEQRVGKDLGFLGGEVTNVDAEYAGAMGNRDMKAVLPNLKYVGKDRAHALRRALRPWDCDDYLLSCKTHFIDGKNAITKAIQFSPVLKKWFAEANSRSDVRTRITTKVADFAWAKQRYDGITQPLGRFVIFIESLVAVANLTIGIRPNDPAAIEFLSHLDNESYLQMAMMADATDELSRSVHAFDVDMLDESDVMLEVWCN